MNKVLLSLLSDLSMTFHMCDVFISQRLVLSVLKFDFWLNVISKQTVILTFYLAQHVVYYQQQYG